MKRIKSKTMLVAAAAAGWTVAAFAHVELATPFSDNMVLQRDRAVPVWGTADLGERVRVSFADSSVEATADAKGVWRVSLPMMPASKENRKLTAKGAANEVVVRNVLVGEVWFASGQSNMQCPIWGENPRYRDGKGAMMLQMTRRPFIRYAKNPRVWSVRPERQIDVVWREMTPEAAAKVTGRHLSAVAFYYALELYGALEVPVGVIDSTWGDTNIDAWTPRAAYAKHPALKDVADYPVTADWKPEMRRGPINKPNQQPSVLWNGMVDAWAPFAIRGFIWYQGCHNASDAYRYCEKMHALYDGWSAAFENPGLKLYFVELAPFRENWFKLQQAQHRFAAEEKNAAYVVTCDCGNQADVHPNDKEIVAKRLALHALKRDYGFADIEDCSPVLKDWKADTNGVVTLAFDHADGWYYYNDDLSAPKGFDIAGSDGVFESAKILNKAINNGILVGRDLQIVADGVTKPRRIRYLANVPQVGSIYAANTSLPLGSFEIDVRDPRDGRRGKLAKTGDALAAASALAGGFHSSTGGIDATDFVWEERAERFRFRFEVADATVYAVSDVKTKRDLERGDRVEVFFSPTQGMDKWYYCAEIDPRGRVLDYRATYHRRFDYAWSFKTLECRAVRTEKGYRVEGSVALDELRSLGLDISDFWLGAFRADYDSEERLVAWFSLLPPGPGEPDFHRPCMLFRLPPRIRCER